jgi:hypothetical protein
VRVVSAAWPLGWLTSVGRSLRSGKNPFEDNRRNGEKTKHKQQKQVFL